MDAGSGSFNLFHCFLLIGLVSLCSCEQQTYHDQGFDDLPVLSVNIAPEYMTILKRKRAEALRDGLLNSSSKDYVPAKITFEDSILTAHARLKGDWLDHLKGKKWSLRIKLDTAFALMGMQQFSIQHPRTRSYLDEWVFHRLLEQEDILTPRYTFVRVWWNDDYKGIYALEEHFEQALLERSRRREGPILKFSEDGFWQCQEYRLHYSRNLVPYLPDFEAAEIEAFQSNKILGDAALLSAFKAGKRLLEQLQLGNGPASRFMDTDRIARLYALCDIASAYHCLTWHNMRFYYDPITARLEPLVFDAYSSNGPYRWFSKPFLGFHNERHGKVYFAEQYMVFFLFNEPDFRKQYQEYLEKFSDRAYFLRFMSTIEAELNQLEKALQTEFADYRYDRKFLEEGALRIQESLKTYDRDHPPFTYEIYDPLYEECKTKAPLPAIALKVHGASKRESAGLRNYFCQPVEIVATGPKRSKPIHILEKPLELPAFDIHRQPPPLLNIVLPEKDRFVFYKVPGVDYWYKKKISKWPFGQGASAFDETGLQAKPGIFKKRGDTLYVESGTYRIDRNMIVPRSFTLILRPGVVFDFVQGAASFIFGPVKMQGSAEKPIRIYSSDKSSRGWHMIRNPGKVLMSHVDFSNLGTWQEDGKILTGGVTLYETEGKVVNCKFLASRAEDGLNIIRSDSVELSDLVFEHCESDALDIDFSNDVLVSNCWFKEIKGDALDLAGTKATVVELTASEVKDKGISIGENSFVELKKINCTKARVGLAVKDGSSVLGSDLVFDNCGYDLAVFNKKPIYREAVLTMDKVQFSTPGIPNYLLEDRHTLILEKNKQSANHRPGQISSMLYKGQ